MVAKLDCYRNNNPVVRPPDYYFYNTFILHTFIEVTPLLKSNLRWYGSTFLKYQFNQAVFVAPFIVRNFINYDEYNEKICWARKAIECVSKEDDGKRASELICRHYR